MKYTYSLLFMAFMLSSSIVNAEEYANEAKVDRAVVADCIAEAESVGATGDAHKTYVEECILLFMDMFGTK